MWRLALIAVLSVAAILLVGCASNVGSAGAKTVPYYRLYLQGSPHKAYAKADNGRGGVSVGQATANIARSKALSTCQQNGGIDCAIVLPWDDGPKPFYGTEWASFYSQGEEGKSPRSVQKDAPRTGKKSPVQQSGKAESTESKPAVLSPKKELVKKPTVRYSETVKRVQDLLIQAGYDLGQADGFAGQKTVAAVKEFQEDVGLVATGQITQELALVLSIYILALEEKQPEESPHQEVISSGSGIAVNGAGYVVTNFHVISDCPKIQVRVLDSQYSAVLVFTDESNDLALLKTNESLSSVAQFSKSSRASLGEYVMAAGFPFYGLLSEEFVVTTGTLSALAGLNNNRKLMQISAPVQPGNSGGPLLNNNGAVIGVVVSKVNAVVVYKLTGDIPQNVNFAIKSSILKSFLDINGVDYQTLEYPVALSSKEIAARASEITALVICSK